MTDAVEAVVFDVAQVIVEWDPRLPLVGEISEDAIEAFLAHAGFWALNAEADAGLGIAEMSVRIDADMPEIRDAFAAYVAHFPRCVPAPMAGTTEVIDELIAAGVPVYGLSNWWAENFTVPRAMAPVIGRLRDVIVSGEVGLAKPDPAIFLLAATRFGVTPERTLFVDDSRPNVDAAAGVGFATHHFTQAAGLREDLVRRGLLSA